MACQGCGATIYRKQAEENMNCCPECDYHMYVSAVDRIQQVLDTGTFESMVEASEFVRVLETRQRLKIGSPEEVAFQMGFIDAARLRDLAEPLLKSGYGRSLMDIAEQAEEDEAAEGVTPSG